MAPYTSATDPGPPHGTAGQESPRRGRLTPRAASEAAVHRAARWRGVQTKCIQEVSERSQTSCVHLPCTAASTATTATSVPAPTAHTLPQRLLKIVAAVTQRDLRKVDRREAQALRQGVPLASPCGHSTRPLHRQAARLHTHQVTNTTRRTLCPPSPWTHRQGASDGLLRARRRRSGSRRLACTRRSMLAILTALPGGSGNDGRPGNWGEQLAPGGAARVVKLSQSTTRVGREGTHRDRVQGIAAGPGRVRAARWARLKEGPLPRAPAGRVVLCSPGLPCRQIGPLGKHCSTYLAGHSTGWQ